MKDIKFTIEEISILLEHNWQVSDNRSRATAYINGAVNQRHLITINKYENIFTVCILLCEGLYPNWTIKNINEIKKLKVYKNND